MEVTADDLLEAASAARRALEPATQGDWTIPAGDLAWDVGAAPVVEHSIGAGAGQQSPADRGR